MKILSPPAHGVFDFLLLTFLALGPTALDFTGAYAVACYGLAAAYLAVTLLTDFPMGLVRLLPYWIHGRLEVVSGVVFLASPWLFGFAGSTSPARTYFMVFGAALLVLWGLTDWSGHVPSDMTDHPKDTLAGQPDGL